MQYILLLLFINGPSLFEHRVGLRSNIEQDKRSYLKSRINCTENETMLSVSSHDSNPKKLQTKKPHKRAGWVFPSLL